MARKFSEAKVGDIMVRTVSDPYTGEVFGRLELTIAKLVSKQVCFNGDKEPRDVFDCYLEYEGLAWEDLFLDKNSTQVSFSKPNKVTFELKD